MGGSKSKWRRAQFKFAGTECVDVQVPHFGTAFYIETFEKIFCLYKSDDCSDPSREIQSTKRDGKRGKSLLQSPSIVGVKSAKYCGKDPIIPLNWIPDVISINGWLENFNKILINFQFENIKCNLFFYSILRLLMTHRFVIWTIEKCNNSFSL